ncbi:MAG: thiamine phosphate synthase [Candidatus Omnitrophica bacterium]|nr:thiamine phosphate synthase [Candidatus Omnitrophota bacterium]
MGKKNMRGFYFVTDPTMSKENIFKDLLHALDAHVLFVQYRRKDLSKKEMKQELVIIKQLCLGRAHLIIDDSVDLAFEINCDGVHLGKHDMAISTARRILGQRYTIGATVQSVEEAINAKESGADYLGVSPIYQSDNNSADIIPLGVGLIKRIKKEVDLPIVASGGITLDNAKSVIEAGANCLSAISALSGKKNLCFEITKFQMLF